MQAAVWNRALHCPGSLAGISSYGWEQQELGAEELGAEELGRAADHATLHADGTRVTRAAARLCRLSSWVAMPTERRQEQI